jgi:hypothetical protein
MNCFRSPAAGLAAPEPPQKAGRDGDAAVLPANQSHCGEVGRVLSGPRLSLRSPAVVRPRGKSSRSQTGDRPAAVVCAFSSPLSGEGPSRAPGKLNTPPASCWGRLFPEVLSHPNPCQVPDPRTPRSVASLACQPVPPIPRCRPASRWMLLRSALISFIASHPVVSGAT